MFNVYHKNMKKKIRNVKKKKKEKVSENSFIFSLASASAVSLMIITA